MKRVFVLSSLFLSLLFTSCSDDTQDPIPDQDKKDPINNEPSQEQEYTPSLSLVKQDIKVGLYPNRIVTDGSSVYVVNSGDNTVGRLNLSDYSYDNNYIKLDQGYYPYSLSLKDNHLYISTSGKVDSNFKSDDVIIDVDLATQSKTEILTSLFMASDIITSSCIEFVESEYDLVNSKANGKITQYCKDSSLSVPTSCNNPTRIMANNGEYIVTCSGVYQYDEDYNIVGTKGSGTCFYNEHLEEKECILKDKDSGAPSIGNTTIIIGGTYSGNITIIKEGNPETTLLSEGSMLVPVHLDKDVYVIAGFNDNILYVYNALKKEVLTEYRLSKTDLDKRGPIDLLYIKDKSELVVLNTLSATIDIFSVK